MRGMVIRMLAVSGLVATLMVAVGVGPASAKGAIASSGGCSTWVTLSTRSYSPTLLDYNTGQYHTYTITAKLLDLQDISTGAACGQMRSSVTIHSDANAEGGRLESELHACGSGAYIAGATPFDFPVAGSNGYSSPSIVVTATTSCSYAKGLFRRNSLPNSWYTVSTTAFNGIVDRG